MRVFRAFATRTDYKTILPQFGCKLYKMFAEAAPVSRNPCSLDGIFGKAPMSLNRTARHVVSNCFARGIIRPHDSALDSQKSVCEPRFIGKFGLSNDGTLIGPEACHMHRADSEQHDNHSLHREAVEPDSDIVE